MDKQLLLIGAGQWILDWCEYHKVSYVLIQKPDLYAPCSAKEVILIDYERDDRVWEYIESLCKKRNVVACLTATEPALVLAAKVAERFRLPYKTCRDIAPIKEKNVMRNLLAESDRGNVPFMVVNSHQDLQTFLQDHGQIIVKPRDGVGSQNVSKIDSSEGYNIKSMPEFPMLAEKYIGGKEYSVEAFTHNGEHHILAVTQKTIDESTFVELRHILPAPLEQGLVNLIHRETSEFLSKVGIENGPSHTELKICDDTIYFIETHNRVAGDSITHLLEMATGINIFQCMIAAPYDLLEPGMLEPRRNGVAAIEFIFGSSGKITSITGLDSARTVANVVNVTLSKSNGDQVDSTDSSYNRLGYIIVHASDEEACMLAIQEVKQRLNVEIN